MQLLKLGAYLLADGRQVLDLTPGADAWKARFAQAYDDVMEIELYRAAWPLWRARTMRHPADAVRNCARLGGFTPGLVTPWRLHPAN